MTVIWGLHRQSAGFPEWDTVQTPDRSKADLRVLNDWGVSEVFEDSVDVRADLVRIKDVRAQMDAWCGWKLLFPEDFTVSTNNHCTVAQLHASSGAGRFLSLVVRKDDTLDILQRLKPDPRVTLASDIPFIKGREFDFITHLVVDRQGSLDAWINGDQVLSHIGDTRATLVPEGKLKGASMHVGLYQGPDVGTHFMMFKDVVCATTEQEVKDWLNGNGEGPPPPPPINGFSFVGPLLGFILIGGVLWGLMQRDE